MAAAPTTGVLRLLRALVLALAAAGAAARAGAGAAGRGAGRERRGLVRFRLSELQAAAPATRARLRWALRSEGAILLTDVPGLSATVAEALDALGDCFQSLEAEEPGTAAADVRRPVASPALLRGGVERWTLATSTRAGSIEPLPDWAARECPGLPRPVEKLRGFIALLLLHFTHSADAATAPDDPAEPEVVPAGASGARRAAGFLPAPPEPSVAKPRRATLEDLVRRGTLLEHFHRYRRSAEQRGGAAAAAPRPLGMHTDAGLLQALAVRWRARPGDTAAGSPAVGLELELPGGTVVAAEEEVASGVPAGEQGEGERAGGLLLLLGQASQEWLPHLRLRAAPHALAAAAHSGSAERLVYGVMVLPPDDWQILGPGAGNATFGEWWRRAQLAVGGASGSRSPAATLGQVRREEEDEGQEEGGEGCLSSTLLQRRLQDQAHTCPAGSIYCWMQCQSVPSELPCKADRAVCISSTTGSVCPDDGTHDPSCKPACPVGGSASFEIVGAGERGVLGAYRSNGWTGSKRSYIKPSPAPGGWRPQVAWDDYWKSDHFGQWVIFIPGYKNDAALYYSDADGESPPQSGWHVDAGALPLPALDYNHSDHGHTVMPGEGFCNGVLTDMHMLGFATVSEDNPCLVFLFPGWELTGPARFWCAVGGSVAFGIFAEWLVAVRRWEAGWRGAPKAAAGSLGHRRLGRQVCRSALYALTRSVGYLVMLVTMTYSAELFVAVIVGLTMGHALFNSASSPGEDLSLCCQAGAGSARTVRAPDSARRLRFQVTGMTCDACCNTVRRAVESAGGDVLGVEALSLASGELLVALAEPAGGRAGGGGGSAAASAGEGGADLEAERVRSAVEAVGFKAELLGTVAVSPPCALTDVVLTLPRF